MNRYVSPIIPALDLMIGQIVWAKGGNRGNYAPVLSTLINSAQPVEVARAVFNQTGCDCLYLANIDSFAGAPPVSTVYDELIEAGFSLLIDADWMGSLDCDKRTDEILALAQKPNVKLIFSTETMSSWDEFSIISGLIQSGTHPIISIDLRDGGVIAKTEELSSASPMDVITKAWEIGAREMILLDLKSVGTDGGVSTESLVAEVTEKFPGIRLISGGGVRNGEDAQRLLTAGCQHVLIASAIFDCKFTPDDVANLTPFSPCSMTTLAMKSQSKQSQGAVTG